MMKAKQALLVTAASGCDLFCVYVIYLYTVFCCHIFVDDKSLLTADSIDLHTNPNSLAIRIHLFISYVRVWTQIAESICIQIQHHPVPDV